MSFFREILISSEMSSKMKVMVPERRADNSGPERNSVRICRRRLTWETRGRGGTNEVNIDLPGSFGFAADQLQSGLVSLNHHMRNHRNVICNLFSLQSAPPFIFLWQKILFFPSVKFSSTARYFCPIDHLEADSIAAPCTLRVIQWREYHPLIPLNAHRLPWILIRLVFI